MLEGRKVVIKDICKNRKRGIILIVVLILAICSCGGILAYLTSVDNAYNSVKVGGVNTEIIEDFSPPNKIKPGTSFTKDVKVQNTGPSDCYVRVKAVFTDSSMGDVCTVDWNKTDYVYNEKDGYYYYKHILSDGDKTESLFTTITVSDKISEADIIDFDVLVYAEAYQSDGFTDYAKAWEHYAANKK